MENNSVYNESRFGKTYTVTWCPFCEKQRYMELVENHNFVCGVCNCVVCKFKDGCFDWDAFCYGENPVLPKNFWLNTKLANEDSSCQEVLF